MARPPPPRSIPRRWRRARQSHRRAPRHRRLQCVSPRGDAGTALFVVLVHVLPLSVCARCVAVCTIGDTPFVRRSSRRCTPVASGCDRVACARSPRGCRRRLATYGRRKTWPVRAAPTYAIVGVQLAVDIRAGVDRSPLTSKVRVGRFRRRGVRAIGPATGWSPRQAADPVRGARRWRRRGTSRRRARTAGSTRRSTLRSDCRCSSGRPRWQCSRQ